MNWTVFLGAVAYMFAAASVGALITCLFILVETEHHPRKSFWITLMASFVVCVLCVSTIAGLGMYPKK